MTTENNERYCNLSTVKYNSFNHHNMSCSTISPGCDKKGWGLKQGIYGVDQVRVIMITGMLVYLTPMDHTCELHIFAMTSKYYICCNECPCPDRCPIFFIR